jgi:hypothetical protein
METCPICGEERELSNVCATCGKCVCEDCCRYVTDNFGKVTARERCECAACEFGQEPSDGQ